MKYKDKPSVRSSKFRNDNNQKLLTALFIETVQKNGTREHFTLYTLRDQDYKGYPSLYRLYMEEGDVTEFRFASKHLESFEHWEALKACVWFKDHATRWAKELELKIRSDALAEIELVAANKDDKNAFNANKFLITGGWKSEQEKKSTVGRPSKALIKEEASKLFQASASVDDDIKRLLN